MVGNRWTELRIREVASNVSSRTELAKAYRGAYRVACKIPGLLDELYGNQKIIWTLQSLTTEASKYSTKKEFSRSNNSAYSACLSRFPGLIDQFFENRLKYWKDERKALEEARKYTKRSDFKRESSGAYKAALSLFPHILHEAFGEPLVRRWALQDLLNEASKYSSRAEMLRLNCGAHAAFSNFPGEIDKVFPPKYRYWSKESDIRSEASKYRTKAEFVYGCISAYGAALQLGIIDELGFEPAGPGFDTTEPAYLYITGIVLKCGDSGVMFGVTNRKLSNRYTTQEREHMFDLTAFWFDRGAQALELENLLRREFKKFAVSDGDSPLTFKKGTSGEILKGVPIHTVREHFNYHCPYKDLVTDWHIQ